MVAAVATVAALSAAPLAADVSLDGAFVQGGLVIGRTEPGSRVALDGRPLRVSADGLFLIGFGRDAVPAARLVVRHADGRLTERRLDIARRTYEISRVDGLPERKVTPRPEDLERIKADNAKIAAARAADSAETFFEVGFAWPVKGRLSGVYGSQRILNGRPRSPHNGVDVAAPKGTPVAAVSGGRVALAEADMFLTGKTVMIDHGHGLTSVYAHMDAITVEKGQIVARGQPIGAVGMTGRATGPHLHWGVTLFRTHLDPALVAGPMED